MSAKEKPPKPSSKKSRTQQTKKEAPAPALSPTKVTRQKPSPARVDKPKRSEMLIEVVSTPTMKAGTDRETCFATIASGGGKITVREYLDVAGPKCRKPRNASWYLGAFVSEGIVKLVERPANS